MRKLLEQPAAPVAGAPRMDGTRAGGANSGRRGMP